MPQICKQALEKPICMLLGEELRNCTVPLWESTFFLLCGDILWRNLNWEWPMVSINAIVYDTRGQIWRNDLSAIQDGESAWVRAVSICASTFLTITQASFQQMLLLTSIAWHQVRISDVKPNCLKDIGGCCYSQTLLCCANLCARLSSFLGPAPQSDMEQITLSQSTLFLRLFCLFFSRALWVIGAEFP